MDQATAMLIALNRNTYTVSRSAGNSPPTFRCLQERFKAALAAEYRRQLSGGAPPNQAAALALRALRPGVITGPPLPRVH